MAEKGYCMKCKSSKEIADAKEVTMKNGRKAMKGKCVDCSTGMYKILGKKQQESGEKNRFVREGVYSCPDRFRQ